MDAENLRVWLEKEGLEDAWLVSLNGKPPSKAVVTIDEAEKYFAMMAPGGRVHLVHVTQAANTPAAWIELVRGIAPPVMETERTERDRPRRRITQSEEPVRVRQLGAKARVRSGTNYGCGLLLTIFFGMSTLGMLIPQSSANTTADANIAEIGTAFFSVTLLILGIYLLATCTYYRCTRCQQKVPEKDNVCPSCRCEFEN